MKTSFTLPRWPLMPCSKTCIAMLVCVLITTWCHSASGQVLDQRISIRMQDVQLESALKKLELAAKIKFFYSLDQLRVTEPVSIEAVDRPLRDVLDRLLTPFRITWRVHEKERTITLKRQAEDGDDQHRSSSSQPGDTISHREPVRGRITHAGTGMPMAGVNILIKGTLTGTTTDSEGNFTIYAEADDMLVFTFIGYKTLELPPGGRTSLALKMEEDLSALDEVVVYASGYNEISPERSTGSYSHLGKDLLERNVGSDILSRLEGLTPALLIDRRSGQPFLNIRGRSTILANDQPLVVVDNFPYDGDLSTINPNDVESVTILKDAAAASIWGVRAGNGVIVITTKKGTPNRPMEIQVNSNVTLGEKPDLFYQSRMSTSDFIDVEKMLFEKGYYDNDINSYRRPAVSPVVELLLKEKMGEITPEESTKLLNDLRKVDVRDELLKHFYRPSITQQYSVSASGSSEKSSFYLSSGYDRNLANAIGNLGNRLSVNVHNLFSPIKDLRIDTRLVHVRSHQETNNNASEIRMGSRNIYPYARFTDEDGNPIPIIYDYRPEFEATSESQGFLNWQYNPIAELSNRSNTDKLSSIRASAGITYDLSPSLKIEARYQFENQSTERRTLFSKESYYARNLVNRFTEVGTGKITNHIPVGGILTTADNGLISHNGRVQIHFNHQWLGHKVIALAGAEVREISTDGVSNRFYGYNPELGSSSPVNYAEAYRTYPALSYANIPQFNSVLATIDRFRGFYMNASYQYRERYLVSISARIDQSNLFGVKANQRSEPLWSAGLKWNLHEEPFFKDKPFSVLALRTTFGYNGNLDQNTTALTTARFLKAAVSQRNAAELVNPPNPRLRWEKSAMLNIGLDFSTLENRLSGSIEYYRRSGIDLIGEGPLDPTTGFDSFRGNVASMKGHGWDLMLTTHNINKSLKWVSNVMFNYSLDEVTDYNLTPGSIANYFIDGSLNRFTLNYVPVEGNPLFSIYSFRSAGLDPNTGDPRGYLNGEPSVDYSAIHSQSTVDSLRYHGPALPPVYGSIRNTFTFRGWSLSFNVAYRFGYFFRRNSISYSELYNNYITHEDFAKRWQQPGDEDRTTVPSMIFPANPNRDAFYGRTESLVERGDNIRIQDLRIAYDFDRFRAGKVQFQSLQIYAYVTSVGLLWRANDEGIDPDFPTMPLPMMCAAGVRARL